MKYAKDFAKEEKQRVKRIKKIKEQVGALLKIPFKFRTAVYVFVDPAYDSRFFFGIPARIDEQKNFLLLQTRKYQKKNELISIKMKAIEKFEIQPTIDLVEYKFKLEDIIGKMDNYLEKGKDILRGKQ